MTDSAAYFHQAENFDLDHCGFLVGINCSRQIQEIEQCDITVKRNRYISRKTDSDDLQDGCIW